MVAVVTAGFIKCDKKESFQDRVQVKSQLFQH